MKFLIAGQFFLTILGAMYLSLPARAQASQPRKVLLSGRAVVRIQEQVYFLSDLAKIHEALRQMDCIRPRPLLLKVLELERSRLTPLPSDLSQIELAARKDEWLALIPLLKLIQFLSPSGKKVSAKDIKGLGSFSCARTQLKSPDESLKQLFMLNQYFLDRYGKAAIAKNASGNTSARTFVEGINSKLEHHLFFSVEANAD